MIHYCQVNKCVQDVYIKDGDDTNWTLGWFGTQTTK